MKILKCFLGFFFLIVSISLTAQTAQWEFFHIPSYRNLVLTPDYVYYNGEPGLGRIDRQTGEVTYFYTFNSDIQLKYFCLYYSPNGLLWLGGDNTLTSFDGSTFRHYNLPINVGHIFSMVQDNSGFLWLACVYGILKTDFETYEVFDSSNTPFTSSNSFIDIAVGDNGNIYAGTSTDWGELGVYHSSVWSIIGTNMRTINDIKVDHNNIVWIAADSYLYKYDGQLTQLPDPGVGTTAWYGFNCIFIDDNNTKWFGNMYGEVFLNYNNGWTMNHDFGNNEGNGVQCIASDSQGNLYVANSHIYHNYILVPQVEDIATYGTAKDYEFTDDNSLWLLIDSDIYCYDGSSWTQHDPVPLITFNDLAIESDTLWAVSSNNIMYYTDSAWHHYYLPGSLSNTYGFEKIIIDGDANIWIGTIGGLLRRDRNGWQKFTTTNSSLPSNSIYSLEVDSHHRLWIGTDAGLALLSNDSWQIFNTTNSPLLENTIYEILADHLENIWIRTHGHLYQYQNQILSMMDTPPNTMTSWQYSSLAVDNNHRLWVASPYYGVNIYDGTTWSVLNESNSELQSIAGSIGSDHSGKIWMSMYGGFQTYSESPVSNDDHISSIPYPTFVRAYPNPFRESTNLLIHGKRDASVSASIYNIRGQLVKNLSVSSKSVENDIFNWDGLDNSKHQVPTGVYLYQVRKANGKHLNGKLVKIK
jgi:ligand-binding sensor domain-containing protein